MEKFFTAIAMSAVAALLPLSAFGFTIDGLSYHEPYGETTTTIYNAWPDEMPSTDVVIPEKVTHLGKEYTVVGIDRKAFSGCPITSVAIPETVTTMEEAAFQNCTLLTSVSLPTSLTELSNSVFLNCFSLKGVELPERLTKIGDSAFDGCYTLENVTLPSTVTEIGVKAFRGCSALTSMTIPENVATIGRSAFDETRNLVSVEFNAVNCSNATGPLFTPSLETITIGEGVKTIPILFLSWCMKVESIVLPESIETIGWGAFQTCRTLTELVFPEKVTTIPTQVLSGCTGLQKAVLGKNVTNVDINAFSGCTSLTSLYSNNPQPPVADRDTFKDVDYGKCVLYVPAESVDAYRNDNIWSRFINVNGASAVGDVIAETDRVKIEANGTGLNIVGAEGMSAQIFGVDGRCEWQTASYGGDAVELQPGIHIVRVGDNTLKVSL